MPERWPYFKGVEMNHMNDTNSKFPRLSVEPTEPPAPLKFPGDRAAGNSTKHEGPSSIGMAEDALARAQRALDTLDEIVDEAVIPFPGRDAGSDSDDDGPYAA